MYLRRHLFLKCIFYCSFLMCLDCRHPTRQTVVYTKPRPPHPQSRVAIIKPMSAPPLGVSPAESTIEFVIKLVESMEKLIFNIEPTTFCVATNCPKMTNCLGKGVLPDAKDANCWRTCVFGSFADSSTERKMTNAHAAAAALFVLTIIMNEATAMMDAWSESMIQAAALEFHCSRRSVVSISVPMEMICDEL